MKFHWKIQYSVPVVWFSAIICLSMAVGLLAGRSVHAAFRQAADRSPSPETAANPAVPVDVQRTVQSVESVQLQPESPEPKAAAPVIETPVAEAETGPILKFNQHNLLIIQVDNLRSDSPELQALWLAIHLPEMGQVMLLPLYPEIRESNGSGMAGALRTITGLPSPIDGESNPHPELLAALQAAGLWWHHSLLLDQIALIELLDAIQNQMLVNGEPGGDFDSLQEVASLTAQVGSPGDYVQASSRLYAQLCPIWASDTSALPGISGINGFSPGHLKTDLVADPAAPGEASVNAAPACQFPSLEIQQ